jgi:hypothetical protein
MKENARTIHNPVPSSLGVLSDRVKLQLLFAPRVARIRGQILSLSLLMLIVLYAPCKINHVFYLSVMLQLQFHELPEYFKLNCEMQNICLGVGALKLILRTYFKIPILHENAPLDFIERIHVQFQVIVPKNSPFGCFEILAEETCHRNGDLIGTTTTSDVRSGIGMWPDMHSPQVTRLWP